MHRLLPRIPKLDRSRLWQFDRDQLAILKGRGDHEAAHTFVTEVVLPAIDEHDAARTQFLLEAAEVARRTLRWPESAAWLDAAEQSIASAAPDDAAASRARLTVAVSRGLLQLERGTPDLAWRHAEAARAAAIATGDPMDAWRATFLELRLAYATGQPAAAVAALEAFVVRHGSTVSPERLVALRVRAAMTVLQGPPPDAASIERSVAWLREAASLPDATADERMLARLHLVLHALQTGAADEAARELAAAEALVTRSDDLDERRLVLPSLRLRLVMDTSAPVDEVRRRAAELAAVWARVHSRWADEAPRDTGLGPLFLVNRQRALVELLRASLVVDRANGPSTALGQWLDTESHGTMARVVGAPRPSTADVQAALCNTGGVAVFVAGPEHGLVLTIAADGVEAFPIHAGSVEIERLGKDLLRAVAAVRDAGAPHETLLAAARALRDALLPEALRVRIAKWRTLALVGADLVAGVPFELLPLDDGRLLGSTHELCYLPSLAIACWLRSARPASPAPRLRIDVVACPDAAPAVPTTDAVTPLPWTAADTERLRRSAASGEVRAVTGRDATLAACDAAAGDLLEIVAHGVRDETRMDPQGILLGDGTIAWPADFERTTLPRFVVFAACRAGRGRLRRGDDGRHLLGGSALLAGARAVVAPWFDVDYEATKALLAAIHERLANGATLTAALRGARAALGGEHGERSLEPFLFHLHGLGDLPLAASAADPTASPSRTTNWLVGAAALLLVLGITVAVRARRAPRSAAGA